MKRIAIFLLSAMLIMSLGACGSKNEVPSTPASVDDGKTYELRLASDVVPENYVIKMINDSVAEISERTNGKVQITVYPGGQLGSYPAVHSQLITGDIDMSANFIDPNYDPRLNVFIFPALVEGYDDYADRMTPGNYLFDLLNDIESDMDLELLGCVNTGLMGIGSVKEPAKSFADAINFDLKKDVLLRIPSMDLYLNLMTSMGYRTTTISYSDLYPALQSGVADGWMGGTPINNWDSFRDVLNYYVDLQVLSEPLPIVINKGSLAKLPQEYQDIIKEVFFNTAQAASNQCEEESAKAIQNMKDKGITVLEGTEAERQQLFAEVREKVWPKLEVLVGDEVYQNLLAEYGLN